MPSIYEQLGIDPHKSTIREIFEKIIDNDFPGAFCNIIRDPKFPGYVLCKHPDGDGSKFLQRLLHFFLTGDITIFQYAVDDALSMNTGDIAASGFVNGLIMLTQMININRFNVPKDLILKQLALRLAYMKKLYKDNGIDLKILGGETADLPDQSMTNIYDMDIWARDKEENIIKGNIKPGDTIFGFASDGRANWEEKENSGIMSNGITMARIKLMHKKYAKKFPRLCLQNKFSGKYNLDDQPDMLGGMSVSDAIMSPTRQWMIVIKKIIKKLNKQGLLHLLHGISMNTGGGASKIKHLGNGIVFSKKMPTPPPIFRLIQQETKESWKNMFTTFNCGVGIDIVGDDSVYGFGNSLLEVSNETGINMYRLGNCAASNTDRNKVIIKYDHKEYRI